MKGSVLRNGEGKGIISILQIPPLADSVTARAHAHSALTPPNPSAATPASMTIAMRAVGLAFAALASSASQAAAGASNAGAAAADVHHPSAAEPCAATPRSKKAAKGSPNIVLFLSVSPLAPSLVGRLVPRLPRRTCCAACSGHVWGACLTVQRRIHTLCPDVAGPTTWICSWAGGLP